jgi:hypothetical protein
MRSVESESLAAAPLLLSAFRTGPEAFEEAALRYARESRVCRMDAGGEECLELLDHLIGRLMSPLERSPGGEDACVFLLEHLAARYQEDSWGMVIH